MENILYARIKQLCDERGISIKKLESMLGFGASSIQKWKDSTSPSIDKVKRVATFFNVSIDYLTGRTDIREIDYFKEPNVVTFQRAREKMDSDTEERMMATLRAAFGNDYFPQEDNNE
jgi:transcriptional regulator with XRE-family HTH domain